jgi:prepilin-type N-terminal cleavage/methylation domain-containing protein
MKQWAKQTGFTIVELLIVIVVIAILAAITIVAYNGIRERAQTSGLQSALAQANKKVLFYAADHADTYPDTLADAGITDSPNVVYQYTSDNTVTPKTYSLTATNGVNGNIVYYISSAQSKQTAGLAPGQNTIYWYKTFADAQLPLNTGTTVTVDTAVSRATGSKSIKIGPNTTGVPVRGSSFTVTTGQVFTLEFWMLTDSTWNGSSDNSKVRFASSGNPVKTCGYGSVKTVWTKVSCTYTVGSGITSMSLTVGNDGTVGNIWLDDISLAIQ